MRSTTGWAFPHHQKFASWRRKRRNTQNPRLAVTGSRTDRQWSLAVVGNPRHLPQLPVFGRPGLGAYAAGTAASTRSWRKPLKMVRRLPEDADTCREVSFLCDVNVDVEMALPISSHWVEGRVGDGSRREASVKPHHRLAPPALTRNWRKP